MKRNFYLKDEVWSILEKESPENLIKVLSSFPPTKIISPLIGAFLHPIEEVRWKAIIAFGYFTGEIAKKDMERARIIIRRLMWMLNEESGGMAWGVPEGFAEALYNSPLLKKEYLSIFVSYLWNAEDTHKYKADNYLEFPPAQRGVIWGIGRLAEKYKKELFETKAHIYVYQHIDSEDKAVCFLSLWSLNRLYPFHEKLAVDKKKIEKVLNFLKKKNFSYLMLDGVKIREKSINELESELKIL